MLRELSEAGAGLALDDFGTGYSSLSYLNQFTFDTIKVDRSFLQTSGEGGTGPVILRSVVALAHELGKDVVVEGVETEEDVGLLRTIGCEYGQGFYYGEPMSEREALQLLKVARRSERRMKRRSLLRKRERIIEEEPVDAAPPAEADAPRTRPESPQTPVASNGADVPPTVPNGVGQPRSKPVIARAPAEVGHTAGATADIPASAAKTAAAPLQPPPPPPPQSRPSAGASQGAPANFSAAPPPTNGSHQPRVTTQPGARPPPLPQRPAMTPPPQPPGPPPLPPSPPRSEPVQLLPMPPNGRAAPDFSKLPPTIAESLARLAGKLGAPPSPPGPTSPAPTGADADRE